MMSWLSSLKLSITQYLLLTEAFIIGLLVVILRVKGSELHKAQVDALEANYLAKKSIQDIATNDAKDKFMAALRDYEQNK